MRLVQLRPSVVAGRLDAPPSKSYTHRALVMGHLAGRHYTIRNPLDSEDTRATRRGIAVLGTITRRRGRVWILLPGDRARAARGSVIDCGQSGSTLRFLTAAATLRTARTRFVGDPSLASRPVVGLVASLVKGGATIRHPARRSLPLSVVGPLRPGSFRVDGSISSQYTSALLMVLPFLDGPSTLEVTGSRVSEPYVDATEAVLAHHRIEFRRKGRRWEVPGGQAVRRPDIRVPGDASSAAYVAVAAGVTNGHVFVNGLSPEWPQPDRRVLEVLRLSGVRVTERSGQVEVEGRATSGFDVDLTASPDLYPLLAVLAATIPDRSRLTGAPHLVHKESDRLRETSRLLRLGHVEHRLSRGGLVIRGRPRPSRFRAAGFIDHRLVMSAAVMALAAQGACDVGDGAAVRKSYPAFWSDLRRIGAGVGSR